MADLCDKEIETCEAPENGAEMADEEMRRIQVDLKFKKFTQSNMRN